MQTTGIIGLIRNSKLTPFITGGLVVLLIVTPFQYPLKALTSGPSQPEAQGFQQAGTDQWVDPFTGNFTYNIDLLEIGGYPINLSYSSGVNMEQEASLVGLGWKLNVGAIHRNKRGLPDDFKGDPLQKKYNVKPNITVGGTVGLGDIEIAGAELDWFDMYAGYDLKVQHNNYTGASIGASFSVNQTVSSSMASENLSFTGSRGISISTSSNDGMSLQPTISAGTKYGGLDNSNIGLKVGYGLKYNSRAGLQQRSFTSSTDLSYSYEVNDKKEAKLSITDGLSFMGHNKLFNDNTYTPQLTLPYQNESYNFSIKIGGKSFAPEFSVKVQGFYSQQKLKNQHRTVPAYGYYYLGAGQQNERALLDFNREKEAPYHPGRPNLPVTHLTYDIFQVGAQQIGGTYRVYRNGIGYVFDPVVTNTTTNFSGGGEVNIGNLVKGGVDISQVHAQSRSSKWKRDNLAQNKLRFQTPMTDRSTPVRYFKRIGALSHTVDRSYKNHTADHTPLRLPLIGNDNKLLVAAGDNWLTKNGKKHSLINNSTKKLSTPVKQPTSFQPLTVNHIKQLDKKYYTSKLPSEAKGHHIGQVRMVKPNGKRYIFGQPAYNTMMKEVSFSVKNKREKHKGLVNYNAGKENSVDNESGETHYYNAKITPPYAYAYYLTDVLSSDYVDRTGNGPTPDDHGNYVKMDYNKAIEDYQWRTPIPKNKAEYDAGLLSLHDDDKGQYTYGTKDVWYIDTIRSKNKIAIFHTSEREGAYEVKGENGGRGSRAMYRLDSISVYNRYDFKARTGPVTPIKRIHFVYNKKLCPGAPNSNKGKLTLQKIYFTHENTKKGTHHPYSFNYGFNPPYNANAMDCWGVYKPPLSDLKNKFYPYAAQDTLRDRYSAAWCLKQIRLPSGGYIQIDYESDRYKFVQEKRAKQMFRIRGATAKTNIKSTSAFGNKLYDKSGGDSNKTVLWFKLPRVHTSPGAYERINSLVGPAIKDELYFKFKVNVEQPSRERYDYIFGYTQLKNNQSYGYKKLGGEYYGWVEIMTVPRDGRSRGNINPIARAAMQFCRTQTPKFAKNQLEVDDGTLKNNPEKVIENLFQSSFLGSLINFFVGPNGMLKLRNIGRYFKPNQSWIRLNCPRRGKWGGGVRVKKITYGDNWQQMSAGASIRMIRTYDYTLENSSVSSGVATYGPLLGGDVIPYHEPVTYDKKSDQPQWARTLIPKNKYMIEKPFGELAFPTPTIGYSRVKINNKVPDSISSPGKGYTVKKYYTAKDYPVKTKHTPLQLERRKKKPVFSVFNKDIRDYATVSQGYAITLNNMHGKPKGTYQYNAQGDLIGYTKKEYSLGEPVKVLDKNGEIERQIMGEEQDLVADFRQEVTGSMTAIKKANFGIFSTIIVIPIGLMVPTRERVQRRFRSATVTKTTYQYGILESVTHNDLGNKITKENEVFDPVTAKPVLTYHNNAYDDTVYQFQYPAHTIYDNMGPASQNLNATWQINTNSNGKITTTTIGLTAGDKLLNLSGQPSVAWASQENGELYLINKKGEPVNGINTYLILQSGYKNRLTATAGEYTSMQNPVQRGKISLNQNSHLLHATIQTYTQKAQQRCVYIPPYDSSFFSADTLYQRSGDFQDNDTLRYPDTVQNCQCMPLQPVFIWESNFQDLINEQALYDTTFYLNANNKYWKGKRRKGSGYGIVSENPSFSRTDTCLQLFPSSANQYSFLQYMQDSITDSLQFSTKLTPENHSCQESQGSK